MQEAANDLVNVEEEAMGEEHVGVQGEEDGVGEVGGTAVLDEDLPAGEEQGGACLPDGGPGNKQGRDLSSADTGVGEDAGAILHGEEQGGAWAEEEGGSALTGEGERCLRRGLKAEGTLLASVSWSGVVIAGPSARLEDSKEGLEDGQLPEGKPGLTGLVCESCWSGSLEPIERRD